MSVSFNSIPAANRVPFVFIEFDNTGANKGATVKAYQALMLGMKLTAGTAAADTPVLVTSETQAKALFGQGSMLHLMCKTWFAANPFTPLKVIPQAENAGGTAGTKTITITGTATEAGTLSVYIGGRVVTVAVTNGMSNTALATALKTALDADGDLPFTAGIASNVITMTARHKGAYSEEIDVRLNYYSTDKTPAGLTVAIATGTPGATNPVLTATISAMAGAQYDFIVNPYLDATSLTALIAEMVNRWGPMVQKEGVMFSTKGDTLGNMQTWGLSQNSQFLSTLDLYKSPTPNFQAAAAYGAAAADSLSIDPARPLQTLTLKGVMAPAEADRRTTTEQNTLLYSGVGTTYVDAGGNVCIGRAITTYQKNAAGAADASYLDVTTVVTLGYIRYDLRTMLQTKFPRHKLANDGTQFGVGQAILTPKAAKAEIVARARLWEENGLVEGIDAFKASLVVERNTSDPNRLDVQLLPDIVNGFVVAGVQIKFLV